MQPNSVNFEKIISNTSSNMYKLPSIQREFVWKEKNVKDFLISVYKDYPLGSIILWENQKFNIESIPFIDNEDKDRKPRWLVIDGQQRLTTLLLIKNKWKIVRDGLEISKRPIYFNPSEEKFRVSEKSLDNSRWIGVTDIINDTDEYDKFETKLKGKNKNNLKTLQKRLTNIQFSSYELSPDTKPEEVANIFFIVNSAGVQVGDLAMFLSLLASSLDQEFKKRIIKFHHDKRDEFKIDLKALLRAFVAVSNKNQTTIKKTSIRNLTDSLAKDRNIKKYWEFTEKYVIDLHKYLEGLGIKKFNQLPSQNVIVPMIEYLHLEKSKPDSMDVKIMYYWIFLASYFGRYSGSPATKLDEDIKDLKEVRNFDRLIKNKMYREIELDDLKRNIHGKDGARVIFLLRLLLEKNRAEDWFGSSKIKETTIHHIFPQEFLKNHGIKDNEKINDIANITLISTKANSSIRKTSPHIYFNQKNIGEEKLKQHLVPPNSKLWKIEKYDDFLKERRCLIYEELIKLLNLWKN